MQNEFRTLTEHELDAVVGGCDGVYDCGVEAGKAVANAIQDAWDWLTSGSEEPC